MFINPLSANLTKWSYTLKQFVGCCRRIVWVCLTILWVWRWKGWYNFHKNWKILSELRFVQTSNKFFRMPCPANIYLFKINNGNRKRCEIRSKLTLKIPAFSVNFEHISRLFLAFLLLTLMREMFTGWANPCLNSVIKTLPE